MSVFFGVFKLDGSPVQKSLLEKAGQALSSSGMDAAGSRLEGSVGFVQHTRWSTPEAPNEKYPIHSDKNPLVLVGDVRLDNRDDLIRRFNLKPEENLGDGHLILEAYRVWGESCVSKLIGDFAFALWDANRQVIFCARDCFGVQPFYYHRSRDFFICSSEIKAILAFPQVSKRLNEDMIRDYLIWDYENQSDTFRRDVKKLLPAHQLSIHRDKFSIRRYWNLNPDYELKLKSDADYAERFRAIFELSVRSRLRSYSPVGALLSGGLDSSAVTVMARNLLEKKNQGLDAFSAVFDQVPSSDESDYIQAITDLKGIRSHRISADRIDSFSGAAAMYHRLEGPHTHDLSMYWGGIYPCAKQKNIRVLLDGDGGDEVVQRGMLRLSELLFSFRWREYAETLRQLSKNTGRSVSDLFVGQSLRPALPPPLLHVWRVARWGRRSLQFDSGIFNNSFVKRTGLKEKEIRLVSRETTPFKTVKQQHYSELMSGSVAYAFGIVHPASSFFGIEHRYPFHDQRLAEYCLSLPSEQKCYRGWTKIVMRRALDGLLPEKVCWRGGKTYLTDDFVYRLSRLERQPLDRVILNNPQRIEPYFNLEELRRVYQTFLTKPAYEFAIIVWQAVMFDQWLEFLEREENA